MIDSQEPQRLAGPPAPAQPAAPVGDLNILILNTHLPIFPGGGGVEYLTTTRMARLAGRVGLASLAHTRADLEKTSGLVDAGVALYLWESPHLDGPYTARPLPPGQRQLHTWLTQLAQLAQTWPHRPADTALLDGCFRNMAPGLIAALSERRWQVHSVIESSAAAMIDYLPRAPLSILVMHDIRAVMYQRRAEASTSPSERRRLLAQARRYYAFERAYCRRYDLVVTVSQHDADWVQANYAPRRVIAVPLPVDAEYFQPDPAVTEVPGRIVFTGLMNHPPNADAALFFARDVLPLVRATLPEAEFMVVGRHPTPEVQALGQLPGVHVTGGVPDVRPFLDAASVVVVPLRYGSGARQKILEAWGMQKCVVATSVGAEGLAYQDGQNLAIADGAQALADTVIHALRTPQFRERLRYGGQQLVRTTHSPERIAANYYAEMKRSAAELVRDAPMRVAIDMRWMLPSAAGGLEQLARAFMGELLALDGTNQYTAIVPAVCRYDFDTRSRPNFRFVSRDTARNYLDRLRHKLGRRLFARLHLDYWQSPEVLNLRFLRELNAEVVYSFPGYIHPELHPLRHVLMVPDIQHEYFPEFFTEQQLEERQRLFGDSIRRADHICAISEFTRQTLIERLGVPAEKITAVPLAADPIFQATPDPLGDPAVLQRYHLDAGRYLFLPGHTWHHKNHRTALAALALLRREHGLDLPLICTGAAREAQPALLQLIDELGLGDAVRFLGYCPRGDLPALYRNAAALVFPSLFEGFGMPVLEAMACGCPVVCSNTTSLPEVAGTAALLVDPTDAAGLAAALARLLRDPELQMALRAAGPVQAARFSWRRHTLETLAVLSQVARQLRQL